MSDEKFAENVKRSPENITKMQQLIDADSVDRHLLEAAAYTEDIIRGLQQEWASRGFNIEQSIFSIALATINLRETMPVTEGGKETFDRVAHEAKKYYDQNK